MKKEQFHDNACSTGDQGQSCACPEKDYLIKEEEEALAMLRELKTMVTVEKARMAKIKRVIEAHSKKVMAEDHGKAKALCREREDLRQELLACERQMGELREQWNEWDEKRKRANREKLIRLGHIAALE